MAEEENNNHDPGGVSRGNNECDDELPELTTSLPSQRVYGRGFGYKGGWFQRRYRGYRDRVMSHNAASQSVRTSALPPQEEVPRPKGPSPSAANAVLPTSVQDSRESNKAIDFKDDIEGVSFRNLIPDTAYVSNKRGTARAISKDPSVLAKILEEYKAMNGDNCDIMFQVSPIDRFQHARRRREEGSRVVRLGGDGALVGAESVVPRRSRQMSLMDLPDDDGRDGGDAEMEDAPRTQAEAATVPEQVLQTEAERDAAVAELATAEAELQATRVKAAEMIENAEMVVKAKRDKLADASKRVSEVSRLNMVL